MSNRARFFALLAITLYPQWLAMMAVHELGHVIHAWISGGHVLRVVIPLLGFSRTDVSPNPRPDFVTWGGPFWGSWLPMILWLLLRRTRLAKPTALFAGFCAVINGAYLATGWLVPDGDAADLHRHGTSAWALVIAGAVLFIPGLLLWHQLGATKYDESKQSI